MLKIFATIIATLNVALSAYVIDGFYLYQMLLFFSGFAFAGLLLLKD